MAFLIDRPVRLDEGIMDALKKLGKGPIEKIKDKLTDAASEQIEYYSKTSLSKMVDDETKESIEDDITDIFTSMIDSIFDLSESEEEFDAEGDRYEELKDRLLGGQTMKYEEMEELFAAAKSRNDREVVDALKNVVDDPPTDGADTLSEDDETESNSIASAAAGRLREGGFDVDVESSTAIRLNSGKTADEDEITSILSDLGIGAQEVSPCVFELDWTDPAAGIADEIEEKEELLPDRVVNEAVETLRRMY